VKRGQALAHISSADLVALQRDYLQGRTQQKLANNMLERDRELYREGIIAERRLLTTQSTHEEMSVNLEQRRQALKLAGLGESSLKRLESKGEMASGLTISAPMDGVVLEQLAATGQRVDMSAPIYRIARLKPLWLEIHAPLDVLSYAKEGMGVNIPQYQASGKIITIIRNVNREDQTVHLRAEISKGIEKLSPGQFVEAEIIADKVARQFAVPKSAVVRNDGKTWLFVQTPKGFTALPVTLINEQSERAIITGNFSGTEKVAVSGTVAIKAAWNGGE
jgi:multidrug efflux pump subunit AcrA (membrane-fusion protein)